MYQLLVLFFITQTTHTVAMQAPGNSTVLHMKTACLQCAVRLYNAQKRNECEQYVTRLVRRGIVRSSELPPELQLLIQADTGIEGSAGCFVNRQPAPSMSMMLERVPALRLVQKISEQERCQEATLLLLIMVQEGSVVLDDLPTPFRELLTGCGTQRFFSSLPTGRDFSFIGQLPNNFTCLPTVLENKAVIFWDYAENYEFYQKMKERREQESRDTSMQLRPQYGALAVPLGLNDATGNNE